MSASLASSAPTISWVDWPAGANFGARALRPFSERFSIARRTPPMAFLMVRLSFSGASLARLSSRGSSMLIERRSA